jgi:hypothetical protein
MMAEKSSAFADVGRAADEEFRLKARDGLVTSFGDMAAGEALARAFVAERTEQRDQAHLWLDVYFLICKQASTDVPVQIVKL